MEFVTSEYLEIAGYRVLEPPKGKAGIAAIRVEAPGNLIERQERATGTFEKI